VHFAHLWQLTHKGNNAEGYWSFAGDRITFQREGGDIKCDRIFVTDPTNGKLVQISNGRGRTTCSYFLPGDREVIFASTHAHHEECPPSPDKSDGYVWAIYPEYDLYTVDLLTGAERRITDEWGYDAEATVSPLGDRIVFTSTRSGDIELWTANLDGSDPKQVTHELGYDGGAFFSHDGSKLVFRATRFTDDGIGSREKYVELLAKYTIRPHLLDLYVCNVDGSGRKRVTDLGGASWAPYFFPGDRRIIFSTNHHDPRPQKFEFDLFAINEDGSELERITHYEGFDSFPMFNRDGRYLVFASNRGGTEPGETNLFVAEWK
jgi:Tol biopolymer transport system component